VLKKYELPSDKYPKKAEVSGEGSGIRQGLSRMTTWTGKRKDGEEVEQGVVRQGLSRMGTWTGLAGRKDEQKAEASASDTPRKGRKTREEEDQDDRRIRFTIGGAGRRMTKEDFLKEIQSLDPKARAKVVNDSTAPEEMKDLARKDASPDMGGSSRLYATKDPKLGSSPGEAKQVAAEMAKEGGAEINDEMADSEASADEAVAEGKLEESTDVATATRRREDAKRQLVRDDSPASIPQTSIPTSTNLTKLDTPSRQVPETAAERRRRENVLRGLDEASSHGSQKDISQTSRQEPTNSPQQERVARETPAERRRREATYAAAARSADAGRGRSPVGETPAEKRRREAALGVGADVADSDSDDDNTERVPQARRPGIRFAEEPIRGRK
jgi:sodium/hydrogen antiporter